MPNKDRLLLLLQTLQKETDDETRLTTADIRAVLEAEGHECSIRTLRKDIASLRNAGYDIEIKESEGLPTTYAYADRIWSHPELQILVDAVSAAQFIPQTRSKELIEKLVSMAGPSHRNELKPQILISERIKAKNRNMIYSVQAIRRAIDRDKKIVFKYLQYNSEKEQVPKHAGTSEEDYIVSPYATVWNNDRYYLVGYSEKRQKVVVFRIDRMEVPRQLPNKRVPPPEGFDLRDYTDKVFWMFDGPRENVTLRCKLSLLDQIIDRFGDDIRIENLTEATFEVTVSVSITGTFFAWIVQFAGEMTIMGPAHILEMYTKYLQKAIANELDE